MAIFNSYVTNYQRVWIMENYREENPVCVWIMHDYFRLSYCVLNGYELWKHTVMNKDFVWDDDGIWWSNIEHTLVECL